MRLPYVEELVLFLLPALAVILTALHHTRIRRGRTPVVRPLRGTAEVDRRLREIAEVGRPLHVATGTGRPGTIGVTAETIASLSIAQRMAERAARRGGDVVVTNGDAVAHVASRGVLRQAYRRAGLAVEYHGSAAQLVAHQAPIPYAAGVAQRYASDAIDSSVVVGNYGSEALLIGEEGARRRLPQVSGATSLTALPALTLSTDATLVGEELFAAEAYFAEGPAPMARLLTQDGLRRVVVLLIVLGIAFQIANNWLGLGLPSL